MTEDETSFDQNKDGYIAASDNEHYLQTDNGSNNNESGVSINVASYDKDGYYVSMSTEEVKAKVHQLIDSFANALLKINTTSGNPNAVDINAVNYATEMTKDLYANGSNLKEHNYVGKNTLLGTDTGEWNEIAPESADSAEDCFGFGYERGYRTNRKIYMLHMTNVISTFTTFYEMYMAVDGDTSKIAKNSGETGFDTEITSIATQSMRYGNAVAYNDIMTTKYNEYKNSGLIVQANIQGTKPTANGTGTIEYKMTDDEDNVQIASVTGDYLVDSYGNISFRTITSIEIKQQDKDATSAKTMEKLVAETGKITHTINEFNIDDKGTEDTSDDTEKTDITLITYNSDNSTQINLVLNSGSGSIGYIDLNSEGDIATIKTIAFTPVTDQYKTTGAIYYIADENGVRDNNYKYYLNSRDVINSVFTSQMSIKPEDKYSGMLAQLVSDCEAKVKSLQEDLKDCYTTFENRGMDYFDAVFKLISKNGWVYDENINRSDRSQQANNQYINAMFENNMYYITEVETLDGTDFNYAQKLAHNVSHVFQVLDTDAQNAALSKYESEKAEITSKEKQLDIRMNKLETEQDAISTEMQSLKKIIDDNVSNTFKIFSWC